MNLFQRTLFPGAGGVDSSDSDHSLDVSRLCGCFRSFPAHPLSLFPFPSPQLATSWMRKMKRPCRRSLNPGSGPDFDAMRRGFLAVRFHLSPGGRWWRCRPSPKTATSPNWGNCLKMSRLSPKRSSISRRRRCVRVRLRSRGAPGQ